MPTFLRKLFSSDGFMPHGHCYLWRPEILWLHAISDGLTALAYTSIPFTLVYFARQRKDVPFNWMFLCFALFIVACGATHYMEIVTLWTPVYRLSGVIKAITAAASVPTAILLIRLVPRALTIPTPRQLQETNLALQRTQEELAQRVEERTAALRKAEERLRQSQKMEAIGSLAGGVAHDFNNLLSVILSYGVMLESGLPPGDPLHREVREIQNAGERAASLTRQLLAFSRKQLLQPRVVNLNDIVTGIEGMLRRLIGEHVELTTVTIQALGSVQVDPSQIEQVIVNLAVNARDAMPDGGRMTIELANVELDASYATEHPEVATGPYVMLAVSDTGQGMDAATRERMFEPFFTTKDPGKGTGLGLATVFGIIKQSGGTIWVYSEPGRGTVFKIYLPRFDEGRDRTSSLIPALPAAGGTERVLLVEDDEQVRRLASAILARNGYRVIEAGNGSEALQLFQKHRGEIDLLLTDVVMPQMGGRQLAEQLIGVQPQLAVLYMSGYTDDSVLRQGVLESGMPFLQKPITPDNLARKVRETLDLRARSAAHL